ncbi:hypothetical protein AVDCRST_MAG92-3722 [uncultured Coleofasciculus sp.]|uniref:Uncharacterized protein n=1 Tax=uncultured Coleofasciculus sp. TaxID=1267456 RepID=A0A6J4JNS0_9CYAN|nr:hypothetical protein AVDCRST_MAG92-3722 [uncultured Coleofasciculus sp.]
MVKQRYFNAKKLPKGAYYHELCLGDGAATSYTTTVPGDLFIKLYYDKACEPPYK